MHIVPFFYIKTCAYIFWKLNGDQTDQTPTLQIFTTHLHTKSMFPSNYFSCFSWDQYWMFLLDFDCSPLCLHCRWLDVSLINQGFVPRHVSQINQCLFDKQSVFYPFVKLVNSCLILPPLFKFWSYSIGGPCNPKHWVKCLRSYFIQFFCSYYNAY